MFPVIHISVPSYSFFAAIGFFVILVYLYLRIDRYQLLFSDFLKMCASCLFFGYIGSRIIYVISRLPWLATHFSFPNLISTVFSGGIVFYGGLLGVLFGVQWYCQKSNIDKNQIFDMITPAIPLFHAFGRIGCFLAGCCHGFELSNPVVIAGNLAITHFPVQIIEASFNALLFIVLLAIQKYRPSISTLYIYMLSYSVFRFIIEFFRGDDIRGMFFGISTSQIISVIIIVVCIIALRRKTVDQVSNYTAP